MKIAIFCKRNDSVFFIEYLNSIKKYLDYDLYLYKREKYITDLNNYEKIFFVQKIGSKIDIEKYEKKNIYIINTEQISRKKILKKFENFSNTIDYSHENISLINQNIIYFPYGINKNEIFDFKKDNNICFIGAKSDKRNKIINELKEREINIDIITGFSEERDKKLFTYKILLNIHFDDNYNIYESIRCDRCVFNKMIVITEKSLLDDKNLLKDKLVICEYKNLVDTVIDVINNYDMYYNKIFGDYDEFMKKHDEKLKIIYEKNIKKL
jgi:hypothetical protein